MAVPAREAWQQHKAWGEAKRNPGSFQLKKKQPTKWATDFRRIIAAFALSHAPRALGVLNNVILGRN
jgi:hypothetical protein